MDIDALKSLTCGLVDEAIEDIQSASGTPSMKENRFQTAAYLLRESKDYVNGAWELLAVDRISPAFALSRWVLEAALNLFWAVANTDVTDQRLKELVGEALRNDATLAESLVSIWPELAEPLGAKANKAREMRKELGIDRKLDDIGTRMTSLKASENADGKLDALGPKQYSLYKMCCSAAHASLKVWGSSDNTLLTSDRACFVAAASPYYLVLNAHVLTGTGEPKKMKEWWSVKVRPLLE